MTLIKAWRVFVLGIYLRCYHAFFGTVVFIVRSSDPGSGGFVDEIQLIHWIGVGTRLNNSCFISIERRLSVCTVVGRYLCKPVPLFHG